MDTTTRVRKIIAWVWLLGFCLIVAAALVYVIVVNRWWTLLLLPILFIGLALVTNWALDQVL